MQIVIEVLQIVAPVFVLASIGYGWVKIGWEYDMQFVTRLAMTLSIPCLIFVALVRADIDPSELTALIWATLLAYGAVTVVMLVLILVARKDMRTYLAPLVFGNTGNVGLPVALLAFGQEGLALAVVVFAVMAILSFTIGVWLVSGGGSPVQALKEPMVGATLLGALFLWQGWILPDWAMTTLDLIGQIGIPVMLLTLGVAIAGLRPTGMGTGFILVVLKLGACIVCAYWAAGWFGLGEIATAVLVLQVAMPVAVTSYMLAVKYEARADDVAAMVVASTLLAVFAIPGILAVVV
ncbi:MAG: AEC family transporter [Rubricella sp.]